jgi:hypothetical protein
MGRCERGRVCKDSTDAGLVVFLNSELRAAYSVHHPHPKEGPSGLSHIQKIPRGTALALGIQPPKKHVEIGVEPRHGLDTHVATRSQHLPCRPRGSPCLCSEEMLPVASQ